MSEFLSTFRRIAAKVESTPGTAETLATADNNCRVWELAIGSLDVPMDEDPSKYATGDFGLGESIPGPTTASISFRTKLARNLTYSGTEPHYSKFLEACGCEVDAAEGAWGSGYVVYPYKYAAEDTITIGVYDLERGSSPSGLFYQFAGCIGNCTISVEGAGKPYNMAFEFMGALNDISDVVESDIPELSGWQTDIPDRFLDGSLTIGGTNLCVSTMEFNFGNTVSPVQCVGASTGYEKYGITAMEPTLTVNPVLKRNEDYDFWSKLTAGTIEEVVITTDQFVLTIPRAQIMSASVEDQEGILRTPLTLRPLRPTTAGSYSYAPWYFYIRDYT